MPTFLQPRPAAVQLAAGAGWCRVAVVLAASIAQSTPLHSQSLTEPLPDAPSAVLGSTLLAASEPERFNPDPQAGKPAAIGWHGTAPSGQTPPPCTAVQQSLPLHSQGKGIQPPGRIPREHPARVRIRCSLS